MVNSIWFYLVIEALGCPNRGAQETVGYISKVQAKDSGLEM